jgi:hypothetical protein
MQEKCGNDNGIGHKKLQTLEPVALSVPDHEICNQDRKNDCCELERIEHQIIGCGNKILARTKTLRSCVGLIGVKYVLNLDTGVASGIVAPRVFDARFSELQVRVHHIT